jgi:iron complex transport system ATP-binding protein
MSDTFCTIDNISFEYVDTDEEGPEDPGGPISVFRSLSAEIPKGLVTFVGQNGTGKTTLMLLCGARLLPQAGKITILGRDTRTITDETERNRIASFVYQNMEFETQEGIEELFHFVLENGFNEDKNPGFVDELLEVFGLKDAAGRRLQQLGKGDIQKAVVAFAMLYGSDSLFMDEPVFALEENQKHQLFEYLSDYARKHDVPVCYSMHELELSRKYSDHVVFFHKSGRIEVCDAAELESEKKLEVVYEIPYAMLYQKEHLHRRHLKALDAEVENLRRKDRPEE